MWKKLGICALFFMLFLHTALADSEILQDLQSLHPENFAQKYITPTQNGFQIYEKLVEELGDFDFWPQKHKKQLRDSMDFWGALERDLQGKVSDFQFSNPLFYFYFADENTVHYVSEEEAREKAVAWAVVKGLLSQENLPHTKVATSLVLGDYLTGKYPSPMWNIRLHGAWDEPIELWLSAMSGKLPKHTSAQVLAKGKQSFLEQLKNGLYLGTYSEDTGIVAVTAEQAATWHSYAVYCPSRGQWRVAFDGSDPNFYWIPLNDLDLEVVGEIDGGNG